jgi:beta-lactamase class A
MATAPPAPTVGPTEQPSAPTLDPTEQPSRSTTLRPLTDLVETPLETLSVDAAEYAASRPEVIGVAVIIPDRGALYAFNADEPFPMASVAKVTILAAVLDRTQREHRALTEHEQALLELMITVSDNDSATALWSELGGAEGMAQYLQTVGLKGIRPNPREYWGASHASPKDVAQLFAQLAWGENLDASRRAYALDLLAGVVPAQRWGVTACIPEDVPEGTVIALKDGWYPGLYGWWVNTAGLLLPGDQRSAYAIAVLTKQQPSFEVGVETVEGVAARVHAAIHPGVDGDAIPPQLS